MISAKKNYLFVSFFNANCRAVSFPSPAFAPVIKILSFILFLLLRLLVTCGMEQPDSQLMMADQRGLRSLDARRSEQLWQRLSVLQYYIRESTIIKMQCKEFRTRW